MKEENEIDNFFSESIGSHEMDPSDKVWESLNSQLDKKAEGKYRAIAYRLSVSLITVIILFTSFVIYHFTTDSAHPTSQSISGTSLKTEQLAFNNTPLNLTAQKSQDKNSSPQKNTLINNSDTEHNLIQNENQFAFSSKSNSNSKSKSKKYASQNNNSIKVDNSKPIEADVNDLTLKNQTQINESQNENSLDVNLENNEIQKQNESNLTKQNNETEALSNLSAGSAEASIVQKTDTAVTPLIQSTEKKSEEKVSKLSVLAYFSPDLNYKFFKSKPAPANTTSSNSNSGNNNNPNSDENDDEEEDYNSTEEAKFSFNSGVLVGYDLNKNWSIKTGAAYSYIAQTIKPKTAIAKTNKDGETEYQFNTSYGSAIVPSDAAVKPNSGDSLQINTKSNQLIQIINIPVMLKYQIIKNKFTFYSQIGFSANFILSQKLSVDYLGKEKIISEVKGLKKFYPGVILGFGASYAMTNKMQLYVEPTFRSAVTPINKYNSKKAYPYTLGLSLGLLYHF